MGQITKPHTFVDNENPKYTDINAVSDTIYQEFNGNIDNSNISPNAAIDVSKLSNVMSLTSAQTVAGQKTLIKPILNGVASVQTHNITTTQSAETLDMSTVNVHVLTLPVSLTLSVQNVSVGQFFSVELIQGNPGGFTINWWNGIKWQYSTTPTLTTTAGKKDTFFFRCTGTNTFDGYVAGQNIG